jgi:ribosomal protein S18 acetylase RimI-like enzyme
MLFYASHADEQPDASVASIRLDPDLERYLCGWGREGDVGRIATDGQRPVGAAWLRLFTRDETHLVTYVAPDVPELAIAVEPDRTGQGVGSLLLESLLGEADADGVPAIVLSARSDNPAVELYRRFGFVEIDRIVNRVGTASVKMIRERTW